MINGCHWIVVSERIYTQCKKVKVKQPEFVMSALKRIRIIPLTKGMNVMVMNMMMILKILLVTIFLFDEMNTLDEDVYDKLNVLDIFLNTHDDKDEPIDKGRICSQADQVVDRL